MIIGRRGLFGLWCVTEPLIEDRLLSVDCSYLYAASSSLSGFFSCSSHSLGCRSSFLKGAVVIFS